jgi:hypothetical protein
MLVARHEPAQGDLDAAVLVGEALSFLAGRFVENVLDGTG